ncbi:MAG: methionine ABC transporter ATP-binding protein [Cellulosilyticaceae bacterium]
MIRATNLTKTFGTSTQKLNVLNNINLHINHGDITGIIGLSGAGKSTLLRIIGGLDVPTSGNIIVNGKTLLNLTSREKINFHKEVGTVFQGYNLMLQKTVAENVALPLEIDKHPKDYITRRVSELLQLVGLEDKATSYPSKLSGGQKQRVAIARALVNNPKLLLCDEPTSALDCITTKAILDLLAHINKTLGVTIVIITHDIDVVKSICTDVVVLHEAEVAEAGPLSSILAQATHPITQQFLI